MLSMQFFSRQYQSVRFWDIIRLDTSTFTLLVFMTWKEKNFHDTKLLF